LAHPVYDFCEKLCTHLAVEGAATSWWLTLRDTMYNYYWTMYDDVWGQVPEKVVAVRAEGRLFEERRNELMAHHLVDLGMFDGAASLCDAATERRRICIQRTRQLHCSPCSWHDRCSQVALNTHWHKILTAT